MTNNGTLDTRASQYLVREERINARIEYGRYNAKKISGGNSIWITHIPPNVKVYFSTDNNFEHKQALDYMNRGMRYSTIGQQGQNQLFDNFYIFTEGTAEDDILINVASDGDAVTPILSSNTNQIDQVDAVGKIGSVENVKSLSPQVISQIAKAIQGIYYKPPIHTLHIQGECGVTYTTKTKIFIMPMAIDKGITDLKLDNDKYYKLQIMGHYDAGGTMTEDTGSDSSETYISSHLCIFKNSAGAIFNKVDSVDFENFYLADKTPWVTDTTDLFDIFGFRNDWVYYWASHSGWAGFKSLEYGFNETDYSLILKGSQLNAYEKMGLCVNVNANSDSRNFNIHCSLILNIFELENAIS